MVTADPQPVSVLHGIFITWADLERIKLRNVAPRTLGRSLAQMDMLATWADEWNRSRREDHNAAG